MKYTALVLVLAAFAGCATTPVVGSHRWHEGRILEIDTAYEGGELTEQTYLDMKNDADQTRVEHEKAVAERMRYRRYDSYWGQPFGGSAFMYRYHHHHHHHR